MFAVAAARHDLAVDLHGHAPLAHGQGLQQFQHGGGGDFARLAIEDDFHAPLSPLAGRAASPRRAVRPLCLNEGRGFLRAPSARVCLCRPGAGRDTTKTWGDRRMKKPVRRLLAAALALASAPAFAQTYSDTVFFGDSLTDSGFYRPFLVEFGGPSAALTGRFTTNPGLVWSEYLADF